MNNENRKEWAVLLSGNLTQGETIDIQIVSTCGEIGYLYLKKETNKVVSNVKEIAPNMVLVQTEETDYYMYGYNLYGKNLSYMGRSNEWSIEDQPKVGEKCLFTRRSSQKGYKEEHFVTPNPVFKLQIIHSSIAIAWCKDGEGEDIGYVINSKTFKNAPTGNCYWIFDLKKVKKQVIGRIAVCFDVGEGTTGFVSFVPKKATAIGDWTMLEAEDGNFYICQFPIEID